MQYFLQLGSRLLAAVRADVVTNVGVTLDFGYVRPRRFNWDRRFLWSSLRCLTLRRRGFFGIGHSTNLLYQMRSRFHFFRGGSVPSRKVTMLGLVGFCGGACACCPWLGLLGGVDCGCFWLGCWSAILVSLRNCWNYPHLLIVWQLD